MASSLGDNSSLRICCHLKRHITSLQLAQVFGMLINNLISMYEIRAGRCKFYAWMAYALTFYLLSMIVLFSKFYFDTYIAAAKRAAVPPSPAPAGMTSATASRAPTSRCANNCGSQHLSPAMH